MLGPLPEIHKAVTIGAQPFPENMPWGGRLVPTDKLALKITTEHYKAKLNSPYRRYLRDSACGPYHHYYNTAAGRSPKLADPPTRIPLLDEVAPELQGIYVHA